MKMVQGSHFIRNYSTQHFIHNVSSFTSSYFCISVSLYTGGIAKTDDRNEVLTGKTNEDIVTYIHLEPKT